MTLVGWSVCIHGSKICNRHQIASEMTQLMVSGSFPRYLFSALLIFRFVNQQPALHDSIIILRRDVEHALDFGHAEETLLILVLPTWNAPSHLKTL